MAKTIILATIGAIAILGAAIFFLYDILNSPFKDIPPVNHVNQGNETNQNNKQESPSPNPEPKPEANPELTPQSAPEPKPQPPPQSFSHPQTPTPDPTDTEYMVNVLVLKYFPLTLDKKNIDIAITGDVGDSYDEIQQRTTSITNNLKAALEKSTSYLKYKNGSSQPSLNYNIVDTRTFEQPVPIKNTPVLRYPDYSGMLLASSICSYVNQQNAQEVWIFAYQGPNRPDGQPYLSIAESKMSGPYGDISNSYRYNDLPSCGKTYRVYTFNYGRGTAEALESWSHQMEAELDAVDRTLFRGLWQEYCGSVHNPPNARYEYDRANPSPQQSDCLDWNPDANGAVSQISCANWGCQDKNDSDNPALNYMVWNWQNLPGQNNTKTYQGKRLRNWWDIHANFDEIMSSNRSLTIN